MIGKNQWEMLIFDWTLHCCRFDGWLVSIMQTNQSLVYIRSIYFAIAHCLLLYLSCSIAVLYLYLALDLYLPLVIPLGYIHLLVYACTCCCRAVGCLVWLFIAVPVAMLIFPDACLVNLTCEINFNWLYFNWKESWSNVDIWLDHSKHDSGPLIGKYQWYQSICCSTVRSTVLYSSSCLLLYL